MQKPTKAERIAKYLDAIPAAIAHQRGHDQTFKVACALFNGWALTEEETLNWLRVYNAKCEPPWSDKELEHKTKEAAKATHEKPRGHLLGGPAYERAVPDQKLPTAPLSKGKILTTLTILNSDSIRNKVQQTTTNSRVETKNGVVNVVKKDSKQDHLATDSGNNVVNVVRDGITEKSVPELP